MTVSGTNFGKAAGDYGTFRAGFPDSLFERLAAFGIGRETQRVIDLGTGTGTLARGFARRGCVVTGIDPDGRMLAQAQGLDAEAGVSVRYLEARAEQSGLPDASADVVTAGQCWHWFDRARAAAEVRRMLAPGGRLVIAHFDWLPLSGSMVEATEQLIRRYNPAWDLHGGIGMHPQWLPGLGQAGFRNLETFSYDVDVPYTPEAWRGRIRASAGVAAMEAAVLDWFDGDLARLLAEEYPDDPLLVPHRVFAIVADRA
jgi:SAM-dependent methyltransferase